MIVTRLQANLTPSIYFSIVIAALMLSLNTFSDTTLPLLSLERTQTYHGEYWRLLSGNFVHFGWAHTLMNTAAFLLCSFALLANFSLLKFSALLFWCCLIVGAGIFHLNPEYGNYAGLSGAIHGLMVTGLLLSTQHVLWLRIIALGLLIAKIVQEQSPNYTATDLQTLVPVPVAVDAHLYGAIAGLTFFILHQLITYIKRRV